MTSSQTTAQIPASPGGRRAWLIVALAIAIPVLVGGGVYWIVRHNGEETPTPVPPDPPSPGEKYDGPFWFRDVTNDSGVNHTYRNGEEADQYTILETLGGGVALIDYNGDGLLDLFVTGGGYFDGPNKQQIKGHPCRLYKNLGNCKFEDVTKEVGLDQVAWWYTHGAAVADYDCDGLPDLLVTGYGRLALFRNTRDDKGGHRFVDVTDEVGLREESWSTSAGWADLHGDGFPDLYVCHYVDWSFASNPQCKGAALGIKRETCGPQDFKPLVHALYRNEKGKKFRNISADHGFRATGCGLGVVLADLNGHGRPDIYVANDTNHNYLYLNRGNGKLEEKALLAGVAGDENGRPDGSMGVDVADYDRCGRPSIWVTNFQHQVHALYRSLGAEAFHHESRAAGIAALGMTTVAFGTGFLDADNDGWEDLVIANGHVWRHDVSGSPKQRPLLLHNIDRNGVRFFVNKSGHGGPFFQTSALGRGIAIGDLDNDGWPDLVFCHTNSPVTLLQNTAKAAFPSNRWLGIKLVGLRHRDVVGSTVILECGTSKQTRFVKGGGSYASANDSRLLFGLGPSDRINRVTVKWSWGGTQTWEALEPNNYWVLHEGDKEARPFKAPD